MKTALVLAAHTDDELGCAATINRLVREGWEVAYHAFSYCDQHELIDECTRALKKLGVTDVHVDSFTVRQFPRDRQGILETLVQMRERKPRLVLVPSSFDVHQDHTVLHQEAVRAFKATTILGYELPHNNLRFAHTSLCRVGADDVVAKLDALSEYKSQQERPYFQSEVVQAVMRVNGLRIDAKYAEAFEVVRHVW